MVTDNLRDIGWFFLCCLAGWLGRQLGVYIVASMAMAASDAVAVGLILGFIIGVILIGVRQCVEYFD